jgi:hypothetical protein
MLSSQRMGIQHQLVENPPVVTRTRRSLADYLADVCGPPKLHSDVRMYHDDAEYAPFRRNQKPEL